MKQQEAYGDDPIVVIDLIGNVSLKQSILKLQYLQFNWLEFLKIILPQFEQ